MEGKETIKEMRKLAEGRLQIMAGGGVTASNIRELVEFTGIKEVHGSGREGEEEWAEARDYVESEMEYRKEGVFMGGEKKNTQELEFKWKQTSEAMVKQFVGQIADLSSLCWTNNAKEIFLFDTKIYSASASTLAMRALHITPSLRKTHLALITRMDSSLARLTISILLREETLWAISAQYFSLCIIRSSRSFTFETVNLYSPQGSMLRVLASEP